MLKGKFNHFEKCIGVNLYEVGFFFSLSLVYPKAKCSLDVKSSAFT